MKGSPITRGSPLVDWVRAVFGRDTKPRWAVKQRPAPREHRPKDRWLIFVHLNGTQSIEVSAYTRSEARALAKRILQSPVQHTIHRLPAHTKIEKLPAIQAGKGE